jgi:hypothetical protein
MHIASTALLAILAVTVPLLHHGHIEMFISDVRRVFERSTRGRSARITQGSSRLTVAASASAMRYEVAVRRKTRAVETSLRFDGTSEDADRWLELLADRADGIRRALGSGVEPERLTRTAARLHWTQIITNVDADWSPKRDLTPELVEEIAARLARFVAVLEPIVVAGERGRAAGHR